MKRFRAPEASPQHLLVRAVTAHKAGRLDEALPLYRRVLERDRGNVSALYGAGMLAWQLGQIAEAVRMLRIVVAARPTDAEAHYNLGCALTSAREPWQALACYEAAVRLNPHLAVAWENLGTTLNDLGERDAARVCLEQALARAGADPHLSAEVRYNLSYPLLSLGRLREGFAHYEARLQAPLFAGHVRHQDRPAWDGQPLEARTLLLHAEQGFGDTIMMLRWVERFPAAQLVLEVQDALVPLVRDTFPAVRVVSQRDATPLTDVQAALLSLPYLLGVTTEAELSSAPYLRAPADPLPLPRGDHEVRVGFVWAGSPDHRNDRNRSVDLRCWTPCFQVPGLSWYSLQVGYDPLSVPCIPLGRMVRDFRDTAGLVAQLDLVISVDTAVAHLAAALGRPTWLLVPSNPDWRWQLEREDSPWYPAMRLFRQESYGAWPETLRRIAEELPRWLIQRPR